MLARCRARFGTKPARAQGIGGGGRNVVAGASLSLATPQGAAFVAVGILEDVVGPARSLGLGVARWLLAP